MRKITTECVVRGYYVTIDNGEMEETYYAEEQYLQGIQTGFTVTQDGVDINNQDIISKVAKAVEEFEEGK